jgi:catechol 2,3-dioxygenase-like lactoylglutathione lyase family enzyme
MRIAEACIVILAEDLDRTLEFYRDRLGLSVQEEEEDWARLDYNIVIMRAPEPVPSGIVTLNTVILSLTVPDVDAAYRELTRQGVSFFEVPQDHGTFKTAALRDPDGNLVQLIEYRGEPGNAPPKGPGNMV